MRRGVCELPLTHLLTEESNSKRRYKTDIENTEVGYSGRKKFRSANNSEINTKKPGNKVAHIKLNEL